MAVGFRTVARQHVRWFIYNFSFLLLFGFACLFCVTRSETKWHKIIRREAAWTSATSEYLKTSTCTVLSSSFDFSRKENRIWWKKLGNSHSNNNKISSLCAKTKKNKKANKHRSFYVVVLGPLSSRRGRCVSRRSRGRPRGLDWYWLSDWRVCGNGTNVASESKENKLQRNICECTAQYCTKSKNPNV